MPPPIVLACMLALQSTDVPVPAAPALGWEWFPSAAPAISPYFAGLDMYGYSCLQPGTLIAQDPVSDAAQWVKSELQKIGLNYRIDQALSMSAMSDVKQGKNVLGFYTMQTLASWVIFDSHDMGGTAGWVAMEFNAGAGLGWNIPDESPHQNIGTVTWPNYNWVVNSLYVSQIAWSQSFFDGSLIVQAGMIDSSISMDANTYANNSFGQLMNWAFVNSQVLPMAYNSLGANIQWQPTDWLYFMFSTCANNTLPGQQPFQGLSADNWSYLGEIGFISKDTFGMGPGVYRVQPFYATYRGKSGGGVALNVEQQLGKDSKLGYFGRFGVGNKDVTLVDGASAQVATGLAMLAPDPNSVEKKAYDYFAAGFVWTQAASSKALHKNEFGVELTYTFDLTPTVGIQPDLQVLWDPAFGPSTTNVVFQVQLVITW